MKIFIPLITLLQFTSIQASLVGIMDSGTDISHQDLFKKSWINYKEKNGDQDLDGDGLPGNTRGYDYTENKARPFNPKYNYLITDDVKTFYKNYAKYETKTISAQELLWLKEKSADESFINIVNFIGGYIHGTHVAGISVDNVSKAKILPMKIIPTEYKEVLAPQSVLGLTSTKVKEKGNEGATPPAPILTIEDFKQELTTSAAAQIEDMTQIHKVLNFHNVDVVNQSFGIGWNDAAGFISSGFIEVFNREATPAELLELQTVYFNKLTKDGSRMFNAAPSTVFCIAAGNDGADIDAHLDYPASINAENKIVVAATNGFNELADFSNFGAKTVDVAAPGVAISAAAPVNNYIALSGTSQAAPYVTNTLAQMKDINPALKARDLKSILLRTVDYKTWLRGKVRTSGIVNRERAKKAAELSRSINIELAISSSRNSVGDVPVVKSLNGFVKPNLGFTFNIKRPSLLIKK